MSAARETIEEEGERGRGGERAREGEGGTERVTQGGEERENPALQYAMAIIILTPFQVEFMMHIQFHFGS